MEPVILFVGLVALGPVGLLYGYDRMSGDKNLAKANFFHTMMLVMIAPVTTALLGAVLLLCIVVVEFTAKTIGLFGAVDRAIAHIFESPIFLALVLMFLTIISLVRFVLANPDMLFEYNKNTEKLVVKGHSSADNLDAVPLKDLENYNTPAAKDKGEPLEGIPSGSILFFVGKVLLLLFAWSVIFIVWPQSGKIELPTGVQWLLAIGATIWIWFGANSWREKRRKRQ